MEITEVKVFPVNEEKLKAFVSIVFDRCFMVNDIKIIQGRDGLFISMPSRKKKNGEFKDVAHPLNNDTRRMIEIQVVEEYERVLAERGESLPAPARAFADGDDRSQQDGRPQKDERPPRDDRAAAAGNGKPQADAGEPAAAPPPPAVRPATEAPQPAMAAADGEGKSQGSTDKEGEEKSLEEVQELHLRDSFWSVS